jgi:hypothetical protein
MFKKVLKDNSKPQDLYKKSFVPQTTQYQKVNMVGSLDFDSVPDLQNDGKLLIIPKEDSINTFYKRS